MVCLLIYLKVGNMMYILQEQVYISNYIFQIKKHQNNHNFMLRNIKFYAFFRPIIKKYTNFYIFVLTLSKK